MIFICVRWINKDYEIEEKLLMKYENEPSVFCALKLEAISNIMNISWKLVRSFVNDTVATLLCFTIANAMHTVQGWPMKDDDGVSYKRKSIQNK